MIRYTIKANTFGWWVTRIIDGRCQYYQVTNQEFCVNVAPKLPAQHTQADFETAIVDYVIQRSLGDAQ